MRCKNKRIQAVIVAVALSTGMLFQGISAAGAEEALENAETEGMQATEAEFEAEDGEWLEFATKEKETAEEAMVLVPEALIENVAAEPVYEETETTSVTSGGQGLEVVTLKTHLGNIHWNVVKSSMEFENPDNSEYTVEIIEKTPEETGNETEKQTEGSEGEGETEKWSVGIYIPNVTTCPTQVSEDILIGNIGDRNEVIIKSEDGEEKRVEFIVRPKNANVQPDTETQSEPTTEVQSQPETEPQSEPETKPQIQPDTEPQTQTNAQTEKKTEKTSEKKTEAIVSNGTAGISSSSTTNTTEITGGAEKSTAKEAVQTGDETMVLGWFTLAVSALVVGVWMYLKRYASTNIKKD